MPASRDKRVRFDPKDHPGCKSCRDGLEHAHYDAKPVTAEELEWRNAWGGNYDDGGETDASAFRQLAKEREDWGELPPSADASMIPLTRQEAASRARPREEDA